MIVINIGVEKALLWWNNPDPDVMDGSTAVARFKERHVSRSVAIALLISYGLDNPEKAIAKWDDEILPAVEELEDIYDLCRRHAFEIVRIHGPANSLVWYEEDAIPAITILEDKDVLEPPVSCQVHVPVFISIHYLPDVLLLHDPQVFMVVLCFDDHLVGTHTVHFLG